MAEETNPGRIPMLDVAESERRAQELGLPAVFGPLSVFRTLLHHPQLTRAVAELLQTLLKGDHLDGRLRELVIMRIGWVTGSVYEWTQHWRIARLMGMSEEELLGVREWRSHPGYGPAERAVLRATDETLAGGTLTPATWEECRKHVGDERALIELVVAIGNWRLFSSLLRSLEIPLEEGTEAWPPDGKRPPAAG